MTVRIDRRYCGPPDSGNGGYVCGILARACGGFDREVTLRAPPPLERDLRIEVDGDGARLLDGNSLIASVIQAQVELEVPAPPTLRDAEQAARRFAGLRGHNFPTCFVCGPDRPDGLRIFTGECGRQVAGTWTPDASVLEDSGGVASEFIWAALDCPGYWSVAPAAGIAVLGRFAVTAHVGFFPAGPLIVTGWPIGSEGRKHVAGTALHDSDGRLLAVGRATWVTLRSPHAR